MKDIVICAVPPMSPDRPAPAPAILKSAAVAAGYSAVTLDLSLEFLINQCNKDMATWHHLGAAFRPNVLSTLESEQAAAKWLDESIRSILDFQPKTIGISVFSVMQHRSTYRLAKELRRVCPDKKIILGGFGLIINGSSLATESGIKKIDLLKRFDSLMLEMGLCDQTVNQNGLDGLIDFLQQTVGPSNQEKKVYDTTGPRFEYPIPNYHDYKLDQYIWNTAPSLPITGSKGCVRACTFCDVPGLFGRFKYRAGKDIAKEMLSLHEQHGIKVFEFTDSLVNGSFRAFKDWLKEIADYNDHHPEHQRLRWFGQYICRPQKQTPQDIYDLMSRSGVQNLIIGVESGSNEVLAAMKKQVTVEDVYDELDQFERYKIPVTILIFSGFYNETRERFQETLEFLVRLQKWVASGIISKISVGPPLYINDKMALHEEADKLGIIIDPYDDSNWKTVHDPENDYVNRCVNRLIVQSLLDKLGVPVNYGAVLNMLENLTRHEQSLQQQINELRKSHTTQNH
jgi:hypothetical protein